MNWKSNLFVDRRSKRNASRQRPGIYEVWALKNVRPVTELNLKTTFIEYLKPQLEPSPFAAAW